MARAIIHVDLDAFYASVEQRRHPDLCGRPVIVGGGPGGDVRRSVVSAASYEARPFGVRSAMPLATAVRLCPHAVVLPVDFPAYREASAEVFAIVREFTPCIEPLSLDEAFLDVTGSVRRFGGAAAIAAGIQDRVRAECRLDASVGVATCKVVAKVASDLRKPRGLVVVDPGGEAAFLAPLPLRALPGLGPATERRLGGLGISTLGELANLPREVVAERAGDAAGRSLWQRAQGIDTDAVHPPGRPKSVSREQTLSADSVDAGELRHHLRELAADVAARLRAGGWRGRTVTLRLRYHDFATITRQQAIPLATDSDLAIGRIAESLFEAAWSGRPVRLVGVGASSIAGGDQLDLPTGSPSRDEAIDRTLDRLRARFGPVIRRGTGVATLGDLDFRGDDLRQLSSSSR